MFMLIDGHGLAYRAYFGLSKKGFTTRNGLPTFAVYGFLKLLLSAVSKYHPQKIAVAFDKSKKTFRNELYDKYKANRKEMPADMKDQLSLIWELVHALGILVYEKEGYEADDIIGTLATKAAKKNEQVLILSGDRDLFQLINDNVTVLLPKPSVVNLLIYTEKEVKEHYGLEPCQIIDYKALAGDSSDNIPGAPGIGEKTAKKLLGEFKTIDNLINNMDKINSPKIKNIIANNTEQIKLSYKLALIDTDVPLDTPISATKPFDKEALICLLTKLEFTGILRELPAILPLFAGQQTDVSNDITFKPQTPPLNLKIISTLNELDELILKLKKIGIFAVDTETTGINALAVDLVGIAIAYEENCEKFEVYLPLGHDSLMDSPRILPLNHTLERLKTILEDENILKIGHNLKYEINVFSRYGIEFKGIGDDTFIGDYVLNPTGKHGLKEVGLIYFGYYMTPISDLIGKGSKAITMAQVPIDEVAAYSAADALVSLELSHYLSPKIKKAQMDDLYKNVELALIPVLAKMEQHGVTLDLNYLKEFSKELNNKVILLEKKIYELIEEQFNINSPKQLAVILFQNLKLPTKGIKKTIHGYSTDSISLTKLKNEHPVIEQLLSYRELVKLKTTYIDAFPALINPYTKRIHTSFNQAITATGRLSSSEPNLQNIPIRTQIGREIRKAFVPAEKKHFILSADYSQIELRVLAHLSRDSAFINAFENDEDIHSLTASHIFKIEDLKDVTKEQRSIAKTVNFGIVYGQTPYGLATTLGIQPVAAKEIIDNFNTKYEGIKQYFEQVLNFVRSNGFITTILNRRRYLPDINSSDRVLREFSERMAINTPIQGSAADIIKIAMIKLNNNLRTYNFKTKMILQVHDELVFEVSETELDKVSELIKDTMENAISLDISLKVDINYGQSWEESTNMTYPQIHNTYP